MFSINLEPSCHHLRILIDKLIALVAQFLFCQFVPVKGLHVNLRYHYQFSQAPRYCRHHQFKIDSTDGLIQIAIASD